MRNFIVSGGNRDKNSLGNSFNAEHRKSRYADSREADFSKKQHFMAVQPSEFSMD